MAKKKISREELIAQLRVASAALSSATAALKIITESVEKEGFSFAPKKAKKETGGKDEIEKIPTDQPRLSPVKMLTVKRVS